MQHITCLTCIYLQALVSSELFAFHTGLSVACPDPGELMGCYEGSRTQGPRLVESLTCASSSAPCTGGSGHGPGREPMGALHGGFRLSLKLGLAGLWCLKTASSQELAERGCACCCWDTVEPWEARPSCLQATALIFTKGLCKLPCLGRPGALRTGAGCQGA